MSTNFSNFWKITLIFIGWSEGSPLKNRWHSFLLRRSVRIVLQFLHKQKMRTMGFFLQTSGWRAQWFRKVLWTLWKWFHLLTLSLHSNKLFIIMRSISRRQVISWSCSQVKKRGSFLRWPKKTNSWSLSPCLTIIESIVKNHLKIITPNSSHLCQWVLYKMNYKIVLRSHKGSLRRWIFQQQVFLHIII